MVQMRKTILLIDDDLSLHALTRSYLEKAGYNFISSANGHQGLEMILSHKPDLILLDYVMPDMNGDQVYTELRLNPRFQTVSRTPVIILTALDSSFSTKTRFLKGGVSAFLHKPFGLRELRNVIDNVFIYAEINNRNLQLQQDLEMISQISHFMQGTVELDQLLHLILTAVTAGCAMGFSRAMILLTNRDQGVLEGRMGVGPTTRAEAFQIWERLAKENISLPHFLARYGKRVPEKNHEDYFNTLVKKIVIPLGDKQNIFVQALEQKKTIRVHHKQLAPEMSPQLLSELGLVEFVIVPLIAKDYSIGVVVADNRFSRYRINKERIHLLTLFANQAGLAIERAEAYSRLEQERNKLQRAYEELKSTQERLIMAERLATIGKMAAEVAHEIRNPLVTIGGFARLIQKNVATKPKEQLKDIANIIFEEACRLEQILTNVLEFSRLSKPELVLVNINQLITESCLFLNLPDQSHEKGIQLTQQLDPMIPPIMLDPHQIKQVLLNLIQNAIQSMPQGGDLTIISRLVNHNTIRVSIQDSGQGIPPEILDQLFNPFFTTKSYGTGLGLSITQQIIHNHGGEIEVASEVGTGTTFSFTLKIVTQAEQFKGTNND